MNFLTNIHVVHSIIIIIAYALTLSLSGIIVKTFIGSAKPADASPKGKQKNAGAIIGKCENFLALTFILAGELTGLALIFTAKSIVRAEDMKKDPTYYLGGTLVNFSFSVAMGFVTKIILNYFGFFK